MNNIGEVGGICENADNDNIILTDVKHGVIYQLSSMGGSIIHEIFRNPEKKIEHVCCLDKETIVGNNSQKLGDHQELVVLKRESQMISQRKSKMKNQKVLKVDQRIMLEIGECSSITPVEYKSTAILISGSNCQNIRQRLIQILDIKTAEILWSAPEFVLNKPLNAVSALIGNFEDMYNLVFMADQVNNQIIVQNKNLGIFQELVSEKKGNIWWPIEVKWIKDVNMLVIVQGSDPPCLQMFTVFEPESTC